MIRLKDRNQPQDADVHLRRRLTRSSQTPSVFVSDQQFTPRGHFQGLGPRERLSRLGLAKLFYT